MNTIDKIVLLFLTLGMAASCQPTVHTIKPSMKKHKTEACIKGLGDDEILVLYYAVASIGEQSDGDIVKDTILSGNGSFSYDIPDSEPLIVRLMPKKVIFTRLNGRPYWAKEKAITLLVRPGDNITIKLKILYMSYEAKGSSFNEEYTQVRESYI